MSELIAIRKRDGSLKWMPKTPKREKVVSLGEFDFYPTGQTVSGTITDPITEAATDVTGELYEMKAKASERPQ